MMEAIMIAVAGTLVTMVALPWLMILLVPFALLFTSGATGVMPMLPVRLVTRKLRTLQQIEGLRHCEKAFIEQVRHLPEELHGFSRKIRHISQIQPIGAC